MLRRVGREYDVVRSLEWHPGIKPPIVKLKPSAVWVPDEVHNEAGIAALLLRRREGVEL